jgi:hypothetical protein
MNIQVIVMSAGPPMTQQLQEWLYTNKLDWCYGSKEYGIDLARNQNIVRFLKEFVPLGKTHLIGIDHDMVPIPETQGILMGTDDLVYCGYTGRHGSRGHHGPNDFGAACFRVSKVLLQQLVYDPISDTRGIWWKTTDAGGVRVECECQYFRKRAKRLGVIAEMVGLIGHQQTCIIVPEGDGYKVMWEEALHA